MQSNESYKLQLRFVRKSGDWLDPQGLYVQCVRNFGIWFDINLERGHRKLLIRALVAQHTMKGEQATLLVSVDVFKS